MCVFKYALLLKHITLQTRIITAHKVCEGPGGVYHNCPTWADTPLGRQPQGRHPPRRTPPGRHTPMQPRHAPFPVHTGIHTTLCPVHAGIQPTSGQYASHWNAFLLKIYLFMHYCDSDRYLSCTLESIGPLWGEL